MRYIILAIIVLSMSVVDAEAGLFRRRGNCSNGCGGAGSQGCRIPAPVIQATQQDLQQQQNINIPLPTSAKKSRPAVAVDREAALAFCAPVMEPTVSKPVYDAFVKRQIAAR